jgi:hypothetical protein
MPFLAFLRRIIIIAKPVGIGPIGLLAPEDVESFYDSMSGARWQNDINDSVAMLAGVHSVAVLLAAAVNPVGDSGSTHPGKYLVPAYTEEEIGAAANAGWIFGIAPNVIETIEQQNNTGLGAEFIKHVIRETNEGGKEQPLLQHFLERSRIDGFSPGFDLMDCVETCRTSAAEMQLQDKTGPHATMALDLLKNLWGTEGDRDLETVQEWLSEATADALAGSEAWLEKEFQLEALGEKVTTLLNSSKEREKLTLSKIAALAEANGQAFHFMLKRFEDVSGGAMTGLRFLTDALQSEAAGASQKQAWGNLLAATYGLIAWHLFRKTTLAVGEAQVVLRDEAQ